MEVTNKKNKSKSGLSVDAVLHLLNDKNLCIHKRTFQNLKHFKVLLKKYNIPYEKIHIRDYDNCVIVELDEKITGLGAVVEADTNLFTSLYKKKERK